MTSARKIKLHIPVPKPRNPLVVVARLRKAGSHRKSEGAVRAREKVVLKKGLDAPGP